MASCLVPLPPGVCRSFRCCCYIAASRQRNGSPFAERVSQQPAPVLIGTDLERTLGIWTLRAFAYDALLAQAVQPSQSCSSPSFARHPLSQRDFSHLKTLVGPLRAFIALLRHSSVVPKCLPNVWLLTKPGCSRRL